MNCDIQIRKADFNDAFEIHNITLKAFAEYAADTTANRIDALTETEDDVKSDIEKKLVLAAEYRGRLSGSLRLEVSEKSAYLTRFAVRAENRSNGIGSALIDHAADVMRRSGVEEIYLHTDLNMHTLVEFYKRHGFAVKSFENTRGYTRALLVKKIS